ncbi:hypothetical protein ACFOEE_00745 [Pseudoalteromonas fenneropenaei]|uniref:Uncharacterized protein n=1 Tax=Pseudoalteromonas fenneropenaei TaxID=1737459 RepID=A0ABV7CCD8_9GAMM
MKTLIALLFLVPFLLHAKDLGGIKLGAQFNAASMGLNCGSPSINDDGAYIRCTKNGFDGQFEITYSLKYGVISVLQHIKFDYEPNMDTIKASLINKFGPPQQEVRLNFGPRNDKGSGLAWLAFCWQNCAVQSIYNNFFRGDELTCTKQNQCINASIGRSPSRVNIEIKDYDLEEKSFALSQQIRKEREENQSRIRL